MAGGGDRPSRRHFYPGSTMTDGQWALLAPAASGGGEHRRARGQAREVGPAPGPGRNLLPGPRRDRLAGPAGRLPAAPDRLRPVPLVDRARAWCRNAALRERARLADGRGPVPTAAVIDSQTVRAADTVPTASSGYDGGKKINGRKRHVAVDTGGLLLAVVVTIRWRCRSTKTRSRRCPRCGRR